MEEIWKDIEGYDGLYQVSNLGKIRNNKTGRILKQSKRKDGYMQVQLGRKTIPQYIHRLVATAFIPNIKNKKQVDHINGIKNDNRLENLRWATVSENRYFYGYELSNLHRQKKIIATNIDGRKIEFDSRDETAKYFKCHKSQISYGRWYVKGNKKGWKFELKIN